MEPNLRELLAEQLRLSQRLRGRIRELESELSAPLAIVGMALRFPGGLTTPEEYWEFLLGRDDAYRPIPADRPGLAAVYEPQVGRPGRSYVNTAGFLSDVDKFDADFFGISAREAEAMDPQQRLLLEVTWEALERAGIPVRREERLDAGVFVGLMAAEYTERLATGPADQIDPYFGTGGGHCFAAGRIAYCLGLRGPAMTVDTACSSSLVALHTAARSLRARECRYAIVGGANLIFSPKLMVSLCQSRALAPDGRCKPFAASANGYGRGEGVAALVLTRLADALDEGLPVLAVLRGSAVNHDGASSGLTVPSGPAQQEVIRAALRDAGLTPAEVSYVEAHGTGTSLGDPIEAAALAEVYGKDRAEPLLVSSVKARLGHLEAAAGMAGLIKIVLMLRHGAVPGDLDESAGELNPLIPWRSNRLRVPRRTEPWSGRVAGISAFGLSGTNAHALLAAPDPQPDPEPPAAGRPELLVLSARTKPALHALAAAVSTRLFRTDAAQVGSVCHTLRAGRTPMPWRLAVVGDSAPDLARKVSLAVDAIARPDRLSGPVELVTGAGLAESVAALATDLPDLPAPGDDPAGWLADTLATLGVPARHRADPAAAEPAALHGLGAPIPLVPADPARGLVTFLSALAALWRAGADLRLAALRAPGARRLPDLPTYPFQRRRFWIDEPAAPPVTAPAAAPAEPATPAGEAAGEPEMVEQLLRAELAAVLKADGEPDLSLTFAELGGDSFLAMLFLKSVEERFGATNLTDDLAEMFTMDQPVGELVTTLARRIEAA